MPGKSLEPPAVIARLKDGSQLPPSAVDEFLESIHHIVDRLVTDDVTVIASPLVLGRPDNPVFERIRLLVKDERWKPPEDVWDAEPSELATALRLPLSQLELYPVYGEVNLLGELLWDLQLSDDDARPYIELLDAWQDSYAASAGGVRRPYRVTPVGRESDFEDWLVDHFDVLRGLGFPVRLATRDTDGLVGRQGHLSRDSRPDLVTRFTEDTNEHREGDWLVIENKATFVGIEAADQLARYVDWLSHRGLDGDVHGLLIADGRSVHLGSSTDGTGLQVHLAHGARLPRRRPSAAC